MKNTTSPNRALRALLALLLIAGLAIISAHPAAAAGPTATGLTAVPAELNITRATATMNTAFDEGNWPRAAAYAELITKNDENAPADVWCKWGYSLRKMGKYDEALAAATVSIEKNPDDAAALLNRGYTYLALGEYQNARLDAEEALQIEPDSASAYNIIASGLLGEGDAKNALVAVDTALALQPDHVNYLNTKGVILMELGKYSDAVTTLTRAVELQDTYIAPYPDAIPPEENLRTAQKLYDENQAPVGLIIAAAALILIIGAGAIFLQKRK
ncbi:tetratricopeptide repeat protein [Methanogenium organophilum]|uniref:Tetratricopeptide repeat protein n=1 Tax=Methanogenium organophilum TaxID=2199 RepID=A0A9X9S4H0_METOG|nr:tetratricopeptide repeat protein [Methanogenium organophilum]WAI01371.1 tetratricopeptide repeat protein [Methanogenium organophilum]